MLTGKQKTLLPVGVHVPIICRMMSPSGAVKVELDPTFARDCIILLWPPALLLPVHAILHRNEGRGLPFLTPFETQLECSLILLTRRPGVCIISHCCMLKMTPFLHMPTYAFPPSFSFSSADSYPDKKQSMQITHEVHSTSEVTGGPLT